MAKYACAERYSVDDQCSLHIELPSNCVFSLRSSLFSLIDSHWRAEIAHGVSRVMHMTES